MLKKIITIELFEDVEISDETYNHVNEMIAQGYQSGEVCQTKDDETGDYVSGWWNLS